MTTLNPLIDGMMKVARLAAAAQCANAPEGTAPSAQVHAEGFEQALRALRAACPLPFEKVPLSLSETYALKTFARQRQCERAARKAFWKTTQAMPLQSCQARSAAHSSFPPAAMVAGGRASGRNDERPKRRSDTRRRSELFI